MKTLKILVVRTDITFPRVLYYLLYNIYNLGFFKLFRRLTAEEVGKMRMPGTWISQIGDNEPVLLSHLCSIGDDLTEYHIALRNDGTNLGEPVEYWEKGTPGQTRVQMNGLDGTMIRRCAWCKPPRIIGTKPDNMPDQPDRITYTDTVCPECAEKLRKDMQERRAIETRVPQLEGLV